MTTLDDMALEIRYRGANIVTERTRCRRRNNRTRRAARNIVKFKPTGLARSMAQQATINVSITFHLSNGNLVPNTIILPMSSRAKILPNSHSLASKQSCPPGQLCSAEEEFL